jgi:hypothetical protein
MAQAGSHGTQTKSDLGRARKRRTNRAQHGPVRAYRVVGGLSFLGSGIGFLIAVAYLIAAEGPGSPDVLSTLASPSGRGLFVASAAAGIVAVVLYVIGAAALHLIYQLVSEFATLVVLVLAPVAAAAFIALLSLQYALAEAAQEGFSTTDVAFRELVVESHSFADAAGWTGIAVLALSGVISSWVFRKAQRWPWLAVAGLGLAPVWLVLHLLGAGYAFLVPFALWEIAVGIAMLATRPRLPVADRDSSP